VATFDIRSLRLVAVVSQLQFGLSPQRHPALCGMVCAEALESALRADWCGGGARWRDCDCVGI